MPVVRYAALAALVVWIGATLDRLAPDAFRQTHLVAYLCGAIVLVALVVIKLVGPPPRAFPIRVALVVVMLAIAAITQMQGTPPALLAINVAVGLGLLSWYVRE